MRTDPTIDRLALYPRLRRQHRYCPVIIQPCPIPEWRVGIRPNVHSAVFGPFLQEREGVFAGFSRRYRWHFSPVGRPDAHLSFGRSHHRPTTLVDQMMVMRAQKGKVLEAGSASVQPVPDVVAVQEAVVGAAGEGATAVAQDEGATKRGGNCARAAAGEPLTHASLRSRVDLSPLRGAR